MGFEGGKNDGLVLIAVPCQVLYVSQMQPELFPQRKLFVGFENQQRVVFEQLPGTLVNGPVLSSAGIGDKSWPFAQ